jgi:hypothetical protein
MAIRNHAILLIIVSLILMFAAPIGADEGKTVSFGVNSTAGGYAMQVNNRGGMNYAKFIGVAPIVNKVRIVNLTNNSIIFDGRPTIGTTIYMPQGSYRVTGWSAYGTEDTSGIVAVFTQAPDQPVPQTQAPQTQAPQTQAPQTQQPQTQQTQTPQTQTPQTQAPQTQATPPTGVNGNFVPPGQDTPIINNNGYPGGNSYPYYPVYNYPGGVPYVYPAPPVTQPRFIWCNYCGRYHAPSGCVFTTPQHNVLEQSNPYWRPPVPTPSPCNK